MNNLKIAGALLLGILISTGLNAQRPLYGGWGSGPNYRMDRLAWLDLSDEQQEQITDLRTSHSQEMTTLKNKMGELKARERTLLSEENIDLDAVNKNIDEQTDLTNSIRKLQVEHQVKIKALLTEEQVAKLQQGRYSARGDSFRNNGMNRGYREYRGNRGNRDYPGYRGNRDYRGYRNYRGYRGV